MNLSAQRIVTDEHKRLEEEWDVEVGFRFNGRLSRSMGRTFRRDPKVKVYGVTVQPFIEYSKKLGSPEYGQSAADIRDVVRHEFAHALDILDRGTSAHDRVWKEWCEATGAVPEAFTFPGKHEAWFSTACPKERKQRVAEAMQHAVFMVTIGNWTA